MPIGLDRPYRVFISEDPIGFYGGDVNFYAYVHNRPTRYRDPFGLINWGNALGQTLDGPVGNTLGYGADAVGMAIDASGDGAYYGGAIGGAIGATIGSALGPAGTIGFGILGGIAGGWLGGLIDDPCAAN